MGTFYQQFPVDDEYSVIVEDDGRVAYAYLLEGRKIVSDVWLYNHQPTPESVDWKNRALLPFLNPKAYAAERKFEPLQDGSEIALQELRDDQKNLKEVRLYIRGGIFAHLAPGMKPGQSKLACVDGPLAKKMENA